MSIKHKSHLHQDWIDQNAFEIVATLQEHGFTTYLVGGCVRDLLLGIQPKDFDIATSAKPQEVRRLIPKAYIIGRRFRLVLVRRGLQQYEVATFRRSIRPEDLEKTDEDGEPLILGDNYFGTPEEDANRRDFRVNGLFYDPVSDELIDYCEGLQDIRHRVMRMIGNPDERLIEDPIRILRALRLAHKIGFSLDPELRAAMHRHTHELQKSVLPRRREEILKLLNLDNPSMVFHEAHDLGILSSICPVVAQIYQSSESSHIFDDYIHRIHQHLSKDANPAERFAYFMLAVVRSLYFSDPHHEISRAELHEHPELRQIMQDELGMFKLEQHLFVQGLLMSPTLSKLDNPKFKIEKKLSALVQHEAFAIALMIAKADFLLAPSEAYFWFEQMQKFGSTNTTGLDKTSDQGGGAPRKRRRRPRMRRSPTQAKSRENT